MIRWIQLLQEFDLEIRDRKGMKNQIVNYLSRLEDSFHVLNDGQIREEFPDKLFLTLTLHRYHSKWIL